MHPRYKGMAEAGAVLVEDIGATVYNPAGLFFVERTHKSIAGLYFDYENLLPVFDVDDFYHHNFSLFGRYKDIIALGITQKYVSYGVFRTANLYGYAEKDVYEYDKFIIITAHKP
jgi:hypothetical protein